MSTLHLRVGFMPLVDCALVVLAKDEGFAETEGLNLELVREVSWSNLRDKLNVRLFDAAHVLAPMALASTLGIGGVRAPMAIPMALNLDGFAVTVSLRRFEELARLAEGDLADPHVSARALAALVARRSAAGLPPLTFAAVFGYSSHTYLLCEWLGKAGLVLGEHIRFEVVPPPQTVEALAAAGSTVSAPARPGIRPPWPVASAPWCWRMSTSAATGLTRCWSGGRMMPNAARRRSRSLAAPS